MSLLLTITTLIGEIPFILIVFKETKKAFHRDNYEKYSSLSFSKLKTAQSRATTALVILSMIIFGFLAFFFELPFNGSIN